MRLTTPPAGQQIAYRIIIDEVPDYSPAGGKYGGDEGLFNYQRTGCRFRFGRLPFGIHVRQQQHHRRTAHPKSPLQHQSDAARTISATGGRWRRCRQGLNRYRNDHADLLSCPPSCRTRQPGHAFKSDKDQNEQGREPIPAPRPVIPRRHSSVRPSIRRWRYSVVQSPEASASAG